MKKIVFVLISAVQLNYARQTPTAFQVIDFHEGMGKGVRYTAQEYETMANVKESRAELLSFFKQIYDERVQQLPSRTARIPLTIHQIWLGPNKMPREFYTQWQRSWLQLHPHWSYKFWTDKDLKKIKFINQELFDSASNWGEKSDIARYEILYQFGGLYVDIDFECLQRFDILHHCFDFFTGIGPFDNTPFYIGNGLMAARPGHLILKECITRLQENKTKKLVADRSGPPFFIQVLTVTLNNPEVGYAVALPPAYFYPIARSQNKLSAAAKKKWYQEVSYAVHHWAGTWKKPHAYIKKPKKK